MVDYFSLTTKAFLIATLWWGIHFRFCIKALDGLYMCHIIYLTEEDSACSGDQNLKLV